MVLISLNVIVDCKLDVLNNKLESNRFPTLPAWFPTGFPTGFPTIFTTSASEREDKDQDIGDKKEDKDQDIGESSFEDKDQEIGDEREDKDQEIDETSLEDNDLKAEKCPENGVKVIKHGTQCGKYILCFGGIEIVRNCAPGLHYSTKLQSCTRPEIAGCKEHQKDCPKLNDPNNLVFIPDVKDCSKYF